MKKPTQDAKTASILCTIYKINTEYKVIKEVHAREYHFFH